MSTEGELITFARDELLQQLKEAGERIWLASPFLSNPVARELASAANGAGAKDKRLLTALVPGSVQLGALDPEALLTLKRNGFKIASISNLHAKVSLIDSRWGLVGSGNLTNAGLGGTERRSVELGIVLSQRQIKNATTIFAGWWEEAAPILDEKLAEFAALPRVSRSKSDPGDFGPAIEPAQNDELERILAEDAATASSRGYWIKANYHRALKDGTNWWRRNWISDWRNPSYREGDLIILYMSGKDDGPRCCPAIVRVRSEPRHDREWVISHGDAEAADQWPYVTETSCVGEVLIPLGVPLSTLDVSPQALQGGYCRISRNQFERAARSMLA